MSARWWAKFQRDPVSGCLLWTGRVDEAGYGRSKAKTGPAAGEVFVHRIVYAAYHGPIPKRDAEGRKLDVDHTCHNKDETCRGKGNACVHRRCGDIDHLELKTHQRNQADAVAGRTHCKYGHPMSGDNLYVDPRTGKRKCKTCNRDAQRRFQESIRKGDRPRPSYVYQPTGRPPGRPKRHSP